MTPAISVQSFATKRNQQAEILVDFVLQRFAEEIFQAGLSGSHSEPKRHSKFQRDDCSDIFDHYLSIQDRNGGLLEIWGQTTCYKGNENMGAEPNKTYEVRETLIEALGLRRWLREERANFRTVHFTVGSPDYTYKWFRNAKDNSFDLSLYTGSDVGGENIFDVLYKLFDGMDAEYQLYEKLEQEYSDPESSLGRLMHILCSELVAWYRSGKPHCEMADKQTNLMTEIRRRQSPSTHRAVATSKNGGSNIKKRAVALLAGGDEKDPIMLHTIKRLSDGKPFLALAMDSLVDWNRWSGEKFSIPPSCSTLDSYIEHLWTLQDQNALISRRLLSRIHSDNFVQYPADLEIAGLTEHNLYNGTHNPAQVRAVVSKITSKLNNAGIDTAANLFERLCGKRGRDLVKDALKAESYNGTSIKPSFIYVEEALREDYEFLSFRDAELPPPVGFHASFGSNSVQPYDNFKVIVRLKDRKAIAIIKAKYFRRQEFPRRAKEESYVGLTIQYSLTNNQFVRRYPELPMIMFIDMDAELIPPEYPIIRLSTIGWEVFFSIENLKEFLLKL